MKQANFSGFGARGQLCVSPAINPATMPDEVVTLCMASRNPEAAAVAHSLNFARARYGYSQADVAKRCGWKSQTYLSEIAKGRKSFPGGAPIDRAAAFVQATGCTLLEQVRQRQRIETRLRGAETDNDRSRAVLARMLAVAA